MPPDWLVLTSRNVWKCAFHLTKTWNIAKSRIKEWRQPNIGKTSNDARIITLKSNPSRGTALRPICQVPTTRHGYKSFNRKHSPCHSVVLNAKDASPEKKNGRHRWHGWSNFKWFYFNKLFDNNSMIMLIYRFCLAYMFRNYARIPRPAYPSIIVLIHIENLGIHNAIHLKERLCMEIHVQRITYADWRCTVYKTYPRSPPPPFPRGSIVYHRKFLSKL